ncbi:MAG: FHA domain-containing protein [Myxococcales bacterium]|jgi:pSer/pThr/pTyr-binding forkhead associated (FHA) protein
MIRLVISDNEGTTTVVPFVRDEITIGRKDGNTIRLTERNISRRHAQLQRVNGSYRIKDLGSYNGVLVNGKRLEGQGELAAGDEITIGDYTILVEQDVQAATPSVPPSPGGSEDVSETEPTVVAPIPRSEPPARMVMLAAPAAGAEYTLPERGELRIGRGEELEISIDHRSVSREHARVVCDGDAVRIIDTDSANGIVVNGERVGEARLAAGDVIRLGDVVLRFVAPGERYVFDPLDARMVSKPPGVGSRKSLWMALAIVGAAVVLAVVIISSGDDGSEPALAAAGSAGAVNPPAGGAEAVPMQPVVDPGEGGDHERLVASCRHAVEGGRFAEAMAHANAALRERPDATDAVACRDEARARHEEEQTFVRGKAALDSGDAEAAYVEFALLDEQSDFRRRPEVAAAVERVGRARLKQARELISDEPREAGEIAAGVLQLQDLPEALRGEAEGLVERAREAAAEVAAAKPRARSNKRKAGKARRGGASPMQTASQCLSRGDNACVIRALAGKARTAQELGLLIETYRAMGNSAMAQRNMAVYVQRFPTGRRADAYRRMLQRQGR